MPAPRNRTILLTPEDEKLYSTKVTALAKKASFAEIKNKTINQDLLHAVNKLPQKFADLAIIDPPYNLTKKYSENMFTKRQDADYEKWLLSWLSPLTKTLKANASIYICSDWRTSLLIYKCIKDMFIIRNRITWQREKGRGSVSNWKNCTEDIWFATVSDDYHFNVDAVKQKRKVIAPYTVNGKPKDWENTEEGRFRLTHPSNFWDDISIPFWSMPESTEHPTQKPEKLIAKLILASSQNGDTVFDPFLGSGTTSVVAKKLGRNFVGIEKEKKFAMLAEKRLKLAEKDKDIQGYSGGVFWERNSFAAQQKN